MIASFADEENGAAIVIFAPLEQVARMFDGVKRRNTACARLDGGKAGCEFRRIGGEIGEQGIFRAVSEDRDFVRSGSSDVVDHGREARELVSLHRRGAAALDHNHQREARLLRSFLQANALRDGIVGDDELAGL
jgi:hypothetical protein